MIFVGDDWAEGHHDVEIVDEQGQRLARRRLPEGVEGVAELHALVGEHLGDRPERDVPDDPAQRFASMNHTRFVAGSVK